MVLEVNSARRWIPTVATIFISRRMQNMLMQRHRVTLRLELSLTVRRNTGAVKQTLSQT
jgi:hypothetical protein